jgi:hypothetical protein
LSGGGADGWQSTGPEGWPGRLRPVSGNARLVVGAPAGGKVHVTGVGRLFRKDEVHIENSVGVVAGDRCRLLAEDHFHVYRATIDLGELRDPPRRLREALEKVVNAPADRTALAEFAAELRRGAKDVAPGRDVEERRVTPRCSVSIADSTGVQLGDGNRLNVHHEYVVELIEVPLTELLTHEDVLRHFAHAMAAPDDPAAMTDFLRAATEALELVDDSVLAALSEPRAGSDTVLHSLFGRAEITGAEPVMIGVDNELARTAEFHLPGLRHGDFAEAFGAVLDHAPVRASVDLESLLDQVQRDPVELDSVLAAAKEELELTEPEIEEVERRLVEPEPVEEPVPPPARDLDEPDPFTRWW